MNEKKGSQIPDYNYSLKCNKENCKDEVKVMHRDNPLIAWLNFQVDPVIIARYPELIAQFEFDDNMLIKNTMWNYVGLIRTRSRLHRAQVILKHLQSDIETFYQKAKLTKEILELRNNISLK